MSKAWSTPLDPPGTRYTRYTSVNRVEIAVLPATSRYGGATKAIYVSFFELLRLSD
jgi:hypothetical protein